MYYKLIKTENKMLLNVNFKFLLCAKQSIWNCEQISHTSFLLTGFKNGQQALCFIVFATICSHIYIIKLISIRKRKKNP